MQYHIIELNLPAPDRVMFFETHDEKLGTDGSRPADFGRVHGGLPIRGKKKCVAPSLRTILIRELDT
jgi:hypothetical protein